MEIIGQKEYPSTRYIFTKTNAASDEQKMKKRRVLLVFPCSKVNSKSESWCLSPQTATITSSTAALKTKAPHPTATYQRCQTHQTRRGRRVQQHMALRRKRPVARARRSLWRLFHQRATLRLRKAEWRKKQRIELETGVAATKAGHGVEANRRSNTAGGRHRRASRNRYGTEREERRVQNSMTRDSEKLRRSRRKSLLREANELATFESSHWSSDEQKTGMSS